MLPPTSIRIAAHDVAIVVIENGQDLGLHGDFKEEMGNYRIRIHTCTKTPKSVIADTLLHEISHALIRIYNISFPVLEEEPMVTTMATAWCQIYRDSPELVKYMQWLLKE